MFVEWVWYTEVCRIFAIKIEMQMGMHSL